MATKAKEYRFPVEAVWREGRSVGVRVEGKDDLAVATPPEFHADADPSVWSPEDLFAAAAASCLAVTIAGLAERERLPLLGLSVEAEGVVGRRSDGSFGFTRIEQRVALDTEPGETERARELVARAERGCLVAVSLDLPVETTVEARAVARRGA